MAEVESAIDTQRLSSFLDIDAPDLQSILDSAAEAVVFLLKQVQVKAAEYEEISNAKALLEVDYEQEVHTTSVKVTSMREQLQKYLNETHELKTKLNNLESEKSTGVSEVSTLKSTNATLEETIFRQKSRIETLETSHKDTLTLLEKKNAETARNEEDYKRLQTNYVEARREVSTTESALQEARGHISTLTYKAQSLQQEVEFLRKDHDRVVTELKNKAADFSTYRKEKSAQISQLQSELEEASSIANSNAEQNRALKRRLEQSSTELERALSKAADLTDRITTQEETHRSELSSQFRLAELWERSCKETQERNKDLESQLERDQEKYSEEVARWQARVQEEESRVQETENRVHELESQVERLEALVESHAAGPSSPIGPNGNRHSTPTPSNRAQLSPSLMSGVFSPSAQAIEKRGRSGMSLTQLYSELHTARQAEMVQRRRADRLQEEYEQYREEAERWAPEYQHAIQEFEQQKEDLAQMSINLQNAISEKEVAERQFRSMRNIIVDKERETRIYQHQARDLGRQVHHLLRDLEEREMGLTGDLSPEENQVMKEMNDAYDAGLDFTDTDKIISQRLTIFHNVVELQRQNQKLLRITRELGDKMERDEKEYQSKMENLESEALNKATEVINQLKDELKSMRTKMESYIRERDMFRRMASGKLPPGTADSPLVTSSAPSGPSEDQQTLLRELQLQFDAYRNEAAIDQRTLNDQIRSLNAERSEALINAAKYKSQMDLANERYKILQGNIEMIKQESEALRKRTQKMQEQQAKQDVKVQQAAEELVDVRGLAESLRTENANLKAERTLFKSIEQRLQSDNEALMSERARLNNLLSNLQTMQNERERQENESRRRSLQETERLEKEVETLKSKLTEESGETKRLSARREYESRDLQERIDKLNAELSVAREQLASATTARDQLQARVEEQGILLKSSEEKLIALSKSGSAQDVNHEQQLAVEVAELKKMLELTKSELREAKEYAEKMKEISATAEEALQEMNTAHDSFKESIDQQLAEKESELTKLKEQFEIVNNELQTSNKELSQIHQQEEERRHAIEEENKTLQAEIVRLKDVEEKAQLSQGLYQDDLRAQAHIAQEAQRNYERELVKHAEAAQNVQQLREEIGNLRTELRTLRTRAEIATAKLQSSESSWESQKSDYERELREVRTRAEDLVKQNNILHQQFESVTSQAQQIRQRIDSDLTALEASVSSQDVPAGKEDSVEGLQEVIRYLRREKEIVDIKYELLQQENRRLKQQLDRTTSDLDETRVLLMSEREKEASAATTSAQHQELLAKINELNLLRESNVTLRNENERNTRRAAEFEAKVSQLTSQLSPLEEKVRVLQAEIESKDDQMRLLTEDNERWKNRNQQILQKYERIDPVELQNLKDQVATANAEKDKLDAQLADAISKNRAVAEAWKAKHDKAVASAKTRLDQNRELIESLEARINSSAKESADTTSEVETVRKEAEAVKQELNQQITVLQTQLEELRQNPPTAGDGGAWETERKALEDTIKQKDAEIVRITSLARGAERAKRETATRLAALEEEVKMLKEQAAQVPASGTADEDIERRVNDEVQRRLSLDPSLLTDSQLRERLAEAEQEKERAITDAVRINQDAADSHLSEVIASKDKELTELRSSSGQIDIDARIAEAVQARELELKELHEQEVKAAAEAAYKRFKQPSNEKILAAGIRHGEKLFNERWEKFKEEQAAGGNLIQQEAITKAVEEAVKGKEEELAEKLVKAREGTKMEEESKNKLQYMKLQRQLNEANAKVASYEAQYGRAPAAIQPHPQQYQRPQQTQQAHTPLPQVVPVQADVTFPPVGQQAQGTNVLQKLQAGRGGGIPRGRGGANIQQGQGRGAGQGQGRGQRLSGQHPPLQLQQPQQIQGQRPAVNRPAPASSPTGGPGQQQRRQSAQQQQQSQLPRPAVAGGLNAGAPAFQPGMKRPRDDENQGGQGNQTAGQKRTRVASNAGNAGNDGQTS